MSISRRQFLRTSGMAAAYAALPLWLAGCAPQAAAQLVSATPEPPTATGIAGTYLSPANADILHLLNRITYGPRPGDIANVTALGYDAFLEQQLHPEQIDDSALEGRLAAYSTLTLSNDELLTGYAGGQKGTKGKPADVILELEQATMLRAIFSERQLLEVIVDFWSNHFNIYIGKNQARFFKTTDDREVIRPHALGTFRELLLASAKSPAMLVYLDNAENVAAGLKIGQRVGGLNENYAREVMELHTVGVDGGYSQADVTTVARVLTGWTIGRGAANERGAFLFAPRLHDTGEKRLAFLDLTLPAGGDIEEGETLLNALASHPKTAARLARKLCITFVSDDPPQALIDRAAQTYLDTNTDIRATLTTILRSNEFKSAAYQKIKLPVRALVSSLRATGAAVENPKPLVAALKQMGQPFFGWQSPNGYPQIGAAWATTSSLLSRWNAAFALTEGRLRGVSVVLDQLAPGANSAEAFVEQTWHSLLNEAPSAEERATLIEFVGQNKPQQALPALAGLIMASPAFQLY